MIAMNIKEQLYFSDEDFKKELGVRIARRRIELKISIEKLAQMVGVTDKTIKSIEKGKSAPRITVLHRMLLALDITYDELIKNNFDK